MSRGVFATSHSSFIAKADCLTPENTSYCAIEHVTRIPSNKSSTQPQPNSAVVCPPVLSSRDMSMAYATAATPYVMFMGTAQASVCTRAPALEPWWWYSML
eukprot:58819-Rhodomonas_salina.2